MLDLEAHVADLWKTTQLPAAFPSLQVVLVCTSQPQRFAALTLSTASMPTIWMPGDASQS